MKSYIFMDESGDLGFDLRKKKTTKYFVITFLFAHNKRSLGKITNKVFSGFTKTEIKNHHGVLHCYKEKPITRIKVLDNLAKQNVSILVIYLNKRNVHTKLKDEKHVLYNYVTNILLDRALRKKLFPKDHQIVLVASKRETNVFLNENFKDYLSTQARNKHNHTLTVEIKTPSEEKGLQIVDFCSWSFFRKYEHKDNTYSEVIKSITSEENGLFK